MMRFPAFDIALVLTFLLCVNASHAQPRSVPDCNLAERHWDNPIGYSGGWRMRRYEWHATAAGLSTIAADGVHRVTHLPRWASAITVAIVPHAIGLATHRYVFDWRDEAFDTFIRAAPLTLWSSARGQPASYRVLAATTFTAGYLAGACWASP